jgi:branched-chain amino acid transport system substrate-binding protein
MRNIKVDFWLRKSALLLLHIILIAAFGCGPAATPIIIVLPTPTGSPPPITEPKATQPAITLAPGITPTSFTPRAVVKIFSNVPLTGDQAAFGQDILHGTELAVQDLSGPLNAFSYKVELVSFDDQNLRETAVANARQIASDPEVLCGVGHFDSDITLAASDIYHQAGLAFVSPSATGSLLTDRNYLETNRVVGREDGQGLAASQFAQAQGFGTIYVIGEQGVTSLRNAEYFRATTGSLGIKWLGSTLTGINNENMDKTVSKVMSANPALVYIASSAEQAIPFLTELRAAGYQGAFLGTEALNHPALISSAGASLVEGGGMFLTISSAPPQYYPQGAPFVEEFQYNFGTPPLVYAARAYDATGICLRAIEAASTAKGGIPPTRSEVARALRRISNYKGISGTYDFNREGDPDPVPYYIMQITSVDAAKWNENPIVAAYEITPP